MNSHSLILAAATLLTVALSAGSAYAFSETEIIRFHDACRGGDRDACMRREQAIHDHEHEAEWRHSHPEWYR
jgi:hypothetical protein